VFRRIFKELERKGQRNWKILNPKKKKSKINIKKRLIKQKKNFRKKLKKKLKN